MTHPHEDLVPYLVGELEPARARDVERHLAACDACRAELHALGESMAVLVESLPPEAPAEGTWGAIARRLHEEGPQRTRDGSTASSATAPPAREDGPAPGRRRAAGETARVRRPRRATGGPWLVWAITASVLLAAAGVGAWWGLTERAAAERVAQEQAVVARWLARDDVQVRALPARDGSPLGSVLVLPDGRALLVLASSAPEERVFQAWGIRGDDTVSLGVVRDRVTEYRMGGFDRFWLSLEPEGGSDRPTETIGAVRIG